MKKMSPLAAGNQAIDFTLPNQNNVATSLSHFQGKKVLLYFYPKAMTPGCTVQAQGLRNIKSALNDLNVVILGVSPDKPQKLANFAEKQALNFILLADEDHAIANAYGVFGEKSFMGKRYEGIHRISFLIDEKGKIIKVFDKFKTKEHQDIVLNYLTRL